MKKIQISILVLFVITCCIQSQQTEKGLYFSQSLGASYNPLGVILTSSLRFRFPLVKKSGILWESTKIEMGIQNEWTPTDDLLVARLTFVPIAFFEFSVQGGPYVMYRQLGYGYCTFDSSDVPYDYDDLEDVPRHTEVGYWFTLTPTLRFKVSSIILANALNINILSIGEEDYFLERRSHSIHKYKDTDIIDDTYLFYKLNEKFMFGANYHFLKVFSTSYFSQRICGIVVLTPKLKAFYNSYAVAVAGAYIEDTVFKGKPYIALRAGFDLKIR